MPLIKKSKPLAVCTVCRALTMNRVDVNTRCNNVVTGRRCSGVFRSGLGQVWVECDGCKGYGRVGSLACRECHGFGWKLG
jgi:DnaJ-class molecular chaperone